MEDIKHTAIEHIPLDYKQTYPALKICYIILTCEKYLITRAKWQKATCFRNTDLADCYYLSCKSSPGSVYGWNTADDYRSCITKYIKFFQKMDLDYDWYMFIDDDTFVFPQRVRSYLGRLDANQPTYLGAMWSHIDGLRFMSGGAGFFLTKSSYKMLKEFLSVESNTLLRTPEARDNGDATVGVWIREINRRNKYCIKLLTDHKNLKIGNTQNLTEVLTLVTIHYVNAENQFRQYDKYLETTDLRLAAPKQIITAPKVNMSISFSPLGMLHLVVRHAWSKLSATEKNIGPKDDYIFQLQPWSVSEEGVVFESVNFRSHYLAPKNNEIAIENDMKRESDMGWKIEAVVKPPTQEQKQQKQQPLFKIRSLSLNETWKDGYLTLKGKDIYVTKAIEGIQQFHIFEIPAL